MIELDVVLVNEKEIRAKFTALPEELRKVIERKLRELTDLLKAKVIENVSGRLLQKQSGQLAASISDVVTVSGNTMTGWVGPVPANIKAWVQEFGGTGDYIIVPINKKWLFWEGKDGQKTFAKIVNHPPLKATHYLRLALAEMFGPVQEGFAEAIAEVTGAP